MNRAIVPLGSGTLFGIGLAISGMTDPTKVLGFLDVAGDWDPSLALVMGAAVAVTMVSFRVILRRRAPLCAPVFQLPASKTIDVRLLAGASLFGFGWGLGGFCPGPAVANLSQATLSSLTFLLSMLAGVAIWEWRKRLPAPWRLASARRASPSPSMP
jgi:hypothetical protein